MRGSGGRPPPENIERADRRARCRALLAPSAGAKRRAGGEAGAAAGPSRHNTEPSTPRILPHAIMPAPSQGREPKHTRSSSHTHALTSTPSPAFLPRQGVSEANEGGWGRGRKARNPQRYRLCCHSAPHPATHPACAPARPNPIPPTHHDSPPPPSAITAANPARLLSIRSHSYPTTPHTPPPPFLPAAIALAAHASARPRGVRGAAPPENMERADRRARRRALLAPSAGAKRRVGAVAAGARTPIPAKPSPAPSIPVQTAFKPPPLPRFQPPPTPFSPVQHPIHTIFTLLAPN